MVEGLSFKGCPGSVASKHPKSQELCCYETLLGKLQHGAMEDSLDQRYAIKFCVKLGKNVAEIFQMMREAFKDNFLSRAQVEKWQKASKEGREEVTDNARS